MLIFGIFGELLVHGTCLFFPLLAVMFMYMPLQNVDAARGALRPAKLRAAFLEWYYLGGAVTIWTLSGWLSRGACHTGVARLRQTSPAGHGLDPLSKSAM